MQSGDEARGDDGRRSRERNPHLRAATLSSDKRFRFFRKPYSEAFKYLMTIFRLVIVEPLPAVLSLAGDREGTCN
jgi:hypothetical protein